MYCNHPAIIYMLISSYIIVAQGIQVEGISSLRLANEGHFRGLGIFKQKF